MILKRLATIIFPAILIMSCAQQQISRSVMSPAFDKEAHRGGRGLMPENTIPAMLDALDRDVTTLEMDLHITKDKQVILSHDPYFNPKITTGPDGKYLDETTAKKLLLYQLNYDEIKKYDVGMKPHPDFPRQQKMAAVKPLLADLLDATEAKAKQKNKIIYYNIEIKSAGKKDGTAFPSVSAFVQLAMKVINEKKVASRTIIQSFDNEALQVMHRNYPAVATSLLIEGFDKRTLPQQLSDLGFTPTVYSPNYKLVNAELVKACHEKGMKVVPWTVNNLQEIKSLQQMGVDGVISDYPDLFVEL